MLNIIQVRSRLHCANELTSGVFTFIRLMESSIQNAPIGTPTKINLLYQILQKVYNSNFRRIWFRVSEWKRTTTRTLRTYKTLSHTHTVYRHTKHSAIRTLCRNTKTFGHTHAVYRQPTQTPPLVFQRGDANDQLDNDRTFEV